MQALAAAAVGSVGAVYEAMRRTGRRTPGCWCQNRRPAGAGRYPGVAAGGARAAGSGGAGRWKGISLRAWAYCQGQARTALSSFGRNPLCLSSFNRVSSLSCGLKSSAGASDGTLTMAAAAAAVTPAWGGVCKGSADRRRLAAQLLPHLREAEVQALAAAALGSVSALYEAMRRTGHRKPRCWCQLTPIGARRLQDAVLEQLQAEPELLALRGDAALWAFLCDAAHRDRALTLKALLVVGRMSQGSIRAMFRELRRAAFPGAAFLGLSCSL